MAGPGDISANKVVGDSPANPLFVAMVGSSKSSSPRAPWATEETLKKIEKNTHDTTAAIVGVFRENLKDVNSYLKDKYQEMSKASEETVDSFGNVRKAGDNLVLGLDKASEKQEKLEKEELERRKVFGQNIKGLSLGLLNGEHSAGSAIKSLVSHFGALAAEGTEVALAFEALEFVLGAVINRFDKTIDSLLELDKFGQGFGLSLTSYTDLLYKSGLTAQEFNKEITQHSAAAAYVGIQETAKLGASFTNLTKYGSELLMTNAEARDMQLDYIDAFRQSGDLQHKSFAQLGMDAFKFGKELNSVTEITGQNREELEKQVKAAYLDSNFQLAIAGLPTAVRENMINKVLPEISKVFGDKSDIINKGLTGYLARGLGGIGPELSIVLNQAGAFDAFKQLGDIAKANGDTTEATLALGRKLSNPETLKRLSMFAGLSGPIADAANQLVQMAQQSRNALEGRDKDGKRLSASEREEQKKAIEVTQKAKVAMDRLTIAFDRLMLNLIPILIPALDIFSSAIARISEAVIDTSHFIDDVGKGFKWLGDVISENMVNPMKDFKSAVDTIFKWIKENLGIDVKGLAKTTKRVVGGVAGSELGRDLGDVGIVGGGAALAGFSAFKAVQTAGKLFGGIIKLFGGGKAAAGAEPLVAEGVAGLDSILPKVGLKGAAKFGGKALGRFIPGVGVVLDTAGAADSYSKGNYLSAGLYAAGAATGALATGLDATGIGAVAGVPLGLLSGGLGLAGMLTGGNKNNNIPSNPAANQAATNFNLIISQTLKHYSEVEKANKDMIMLLSRCETALDVLASVTARGHDNMVNALKKSGNTIY